MNLYTQKDKNIRRTWILMTIFLIVIIAIGWYLSYYFQSQEILIIALIFSIGLNFFGYWFSDKIVLKMTRGKRLKFEDNPEIFRIVENLCITAGLPMPKVYILPELSLNAFATGRNHKNSSIALTEGLIKKLDKNELEGVIAHELSHIGNYDTLLQTIVVILVGLIVIVSDMFFRTRLLGFGGKGSNRDRNNGDSQLGAIIMITGVILLILSPLIAKLIQLAISRKREYLADSSSVLLTRYSEGLASALEKISNDKTSVRFASNATAHLFIANPFRAEKKPRFSKFFQTHPPIEERIRILRSMGE